MAHPHVLHTIWLDSREPTNTDTLWIKPLPKGQYGAFVYGQNGWIMTTALFKGTLGEFVVNDLPEATEDSNGVMSYIDKRILDSLDLEAVRLGDLVKNIFEKKVNYLKDKDGYIIFPVTHEDAVIDTQGKTLTEKLADKQDTLKSGINIKTINNQSILGDGNITIDTSAEPQIFLTWSELKELQNSRELVPGCVYRITDYVATTTDVNTRSANHPFDIITKAIDECNLSEECLAALHHGDTYFANSNLAAWKIWYRLNNDTATFDWADPMNGKGVIYRMIDEFGNDIGYDFKGIQLARYRVTPAIGYENVLSSISGMWLGRNHSFTPMGLDVDISEVKWFYTFSYLANGWDNAEDASIVSNGGCYGNIIPLALLRGSSRYINNNVFLNGQFPVDTLKAIDSGAMTILNSCNFVANADCSRNTFFGGGCNTVADSQFRDNIFFGPFRHNVVGTDVERNTVVAYHDIAANRMNMYKNVISSSRFTSTRTDQTFHDNTFNVTGEFTGCSFNGFSTDNNVTCGGNIAWCTAEYFNNNNLNVSGNITNNLFGPNFKANTATITGGISNVTFSKQVNNNTFLSDLVGCNFDGIVSYVTIPAVSGKRFANCDVRGGVRGTSSSSFSLDYQGFFLSGVTGITRRVSIEGTVDSKVVATWKDNGVIKGVMKAPGGTWESIPDIDDKQDVLVSGENIKTVNGQSILGSGNIPIEGASDAVKYTSQSLTDAQKTQARTNIAAASDSEVSQLRSEVNGIDAGDTSSYQLLPGFIGIGGAVNSNVNWRHTSAIPVPKGATITVVTAGTTVCAIAQDNNGTYTPLFLSKNSGDAEILNTYSYVAQDDINVSVSLKVSVSGYSISVDGKFVALTNKIDNLQNAIGYESYEYRIQNGSQGNGGNEWVVTLKGKTTTTIPVTPGHIYKLVFNKKPENGFHFYWRIGTYSTPNGANLYSNLVRAEYNSWNVYHTDTDTFDIRAGEYGLSIQLTELTEPGAAQAAGTCIALRTYDFNSSDIELYDITESAVYHTETVVDRNSDKIPALVNACLRGKASANSKNLQLLVCADSHGYKLGNDNAVLATNGFDTIDAYVHVGDIVPGYYQPAYITRFQQELSNLTKPGYIVVGNHDVGNCYYAGYACDHQQAYNAYIKPMVDNGWLSSGEYEVGKPYWFHDNATYKVRFIGLYEYDDNLDFNETYWKAIEYDSSLPKLTFNTAYQTGAKVNAGDHTSHSFEAVQDVTTPANYYTTPSKLPSYIVQRGTRVIRQTQAQWFLDTLASTPASYGVIVIMHNPFSDNAVSMEKKFSWPANVNGSSYSQNSMTTDFVRNAIAAFMAGSNYSEKVVMKGNAAYMNTLNDGTIDYAYEVSKNFAQKNTGVYLLGLLGGHSHRDIIWKDPSQNIYQVAPNCAAVDGSNDKNGDVRRTNTDGIAADSLTVVSFSSGRIALVKIGVNVTENGTDRDYEVIS